MSNFVSVLLPLSEHLECACVYEDHMPVLRLQSPLSEANSFVQCAVPPIFHSPPGMVWGCSQNTHNIPQGNITSSQPMLGSGRPFRVVAFKGLTVFFDALVQSPSGLFYTFHTIATWSSVYHTCEVILVHIVSARLKVYAS